ncbi:plus-3-domain-containing protein [Epithele typhae]|uniref:plus-3-domain-containing protein n=1 Tax=Epithele typhae TaxID=378194 RepID=UPI002008CF5A|nr:plus-3-domain-containing protein [Epithele typhae]KAH9928002.1 plus-3-domain-containing protein [Epithele typhae]
MSDQEDIDFDEQLLVLAGVTEKKRKRSQQGASSSKRRKADMNEDGESEQSNAESEDEMSSSNPYPLDNRYVDEADRAHLMELPEIEREAILAQRQEEMQRSKDKQALEKMLQQQNGRGVSSDEGVSKAAKRPHGARGATKEKSKKLDELKAKRRAKDEKKRTRTNSPKRDRSSSPMDMETSDGEDEDGQITKTDLEEERDRRLFGKDAPEDDGPITLDDLNLAWISRDMIAKFCWAPWFEEFVKGGWVRFLTPPVAGGEPTYRLCEVQGLSDLQGEKPVKPYQVNKQMVNQVMELKHGATSRFFPMDKMSNSPFQQACCIFTVVRSLISWLPQSEFDHLARTYEHDKVKLPTKRQLEKKQEQLLKFSTQPMTESDVAAMLARKQALDVGRTGATGNNFFERSRLQHARTLAIRRNDATEVAELDIKLAELAAKTPQREQEAEGSADKLTKLNERNRQLNLAQIRQAERAEAERKRQRSSAAVARLKAKKEAEASRSVLGNTPGTPAKEGTPATGSPSGTPARDAPPPRRNGMSFEASILQTVEIDLGDF